MYIKKSTLNRLVKADPKFQLLQERHPRIDVSAYYLWLLDQDFDTTAQFLESLRGRFPQGFAENFCKFLATVDLSGDFTNRGVEIKLEATIINYVFVGELS
jgi:hypothetical protein